MLISWLCLCLCSALPQHETQVSPRFLQSLIIRAPASIRQALGRTAQPDSPRFVCVASSLQILFGPHGDSHPLRLSSLPSLSAAFLPCPPGTPLCPHLRYLRYPSLPAWPGPTFTGLARSPTFCAHSQEGTWGRTSQQHPGVRWQWHPTPASPDLPTLLTAQCPPASHRQKPFVPNAASRAFSDSHGIFSTTPLGTLPSLCADLATASLPRHLWPALVGPPLGTAPHLHLHPQLPQVPPPPLSSTWPSSAYGGRSWRCRKARVKKQKEKEGKPTIFRS